MIDCAWEIWLCWPREMKEKKQNYIWERKENKNTVKPVWLPNKCDGET